MMKRARVLVAFFVVSVVAATLAIVSDAFGQLPLLSGAVYRSTGDLVANAKVEVMSRIDGSVVAATTTTTGGVYNVRVATGSYDLVFTSPEGEKPARISLPDVAVGSSATYVDALLIEDLATVSGRVITTPDSSVGLPFVSLNGSGSVSAYPTPAADGSFSADIPKGDYSIGAFASLPLPTAGVAFLSWRGDVLRYNGDWTTPDIDFRTQTRRIRVLDDNDRPIPGVLVNVTTPEVATGFRFVGSGMRTNASGVVEFSSLPVSNATIVVAQFNGTVMQTVATSLATTVETVVRVAPQFEVKGRASFTGPGQYAFAGGTTEFRVQFRSTLYGFGAQEAKVNADGTYAIRLSAGTYTPVLIGSWTNPSASASFTKVLDPILVSADTTLPDAELATVSRKVIVQSLTGTPLPGFVLSGFGDPTSGEFPSAFRGFYTQQDGSVEVPMLVGSTSFMSVAVPSNQLNMIRRFDLSPGAEPYVVRIPKMVTIQGFIHARGAVPSGESASYIALSGTDENGVRTEFSTTANSAGWYSLTVPAGAYTGVATTSFSGPFSYFAETIPSTTFAANTSLADIVFDIVNRQVRVSKTRGVAQPGVYVSATDFGAPAGQRFMSSGQTGADGVATLAVLTHTAYVYMYQPGMFFPTLWHDFSSTSPLRLVLSGSTVFSGTASTDGDNVADAVEASAPDGDENRDGVLDFRQGNVASLPANGLEEGPHIAVAVPKAHLVGNVRTESIANYPALPGAASLANGLIHFSVDGVPANSDLTVELYLPSLEGVTGYAKFNPNTNTWTALPADRVSIDPINKALLIRITDNGIGDDDPTPGRISDPGGPVIGSLLGSTPDAPPATTTTTTTSTTVAPVTTTTTTAPTKTTTTTTITPTSSSTSGVASAVGGSAPTGGSPQQPAQQPAQQPGQQAVQEQSPSTSATTSPSNSSRIAVSVLSSTEEAAPAVGIEAGVIDTSPIPYASAAPFTVATPAFTG